MPRITGSLADEVARYMDRSTRDGACLIRPGTSGYGGISYGRGLRVAAHRGVYTVTFGPIPDGLVVRHTCDRVGCIEPSHLLVGTYTDNERDKHERGRAPVGERAWNAHPESLVQAVRDAYAEGEHTKPELAEQFGVSVGTLDKWTKGVIRGLTPLHVRDGRFPGAAKCGTRSGYVVHLRRGEERCAGCLEANRVYMRAYKASRRAAAAPAIFVGDDT